MPKDWLDQISVPGFPNQLNGPGYTGISGGLEYIINNFIPFLVSLLIFLVIVLSLVFLIIGGIMWITSGGNKEGLAKAKSAVTYALVGLVLGLGSFIILRILGDFFGFDLIPKVARYIGH